VWAWIAACSPDSVPGGAFPGQVRVDPPVVEDGPNPSVGPVRVWSVHASAPIEVALTVLGGGEVHRLRSAPATDHHVPLLGLVPGTSYRVEAEVVGSLAPLPQVTFTTEDPPEAPFWPTFDALAWDPTRAEPGWTLIPVNPQLADGGAIVLLDRDLRVRWWYTSATAHLWDAAPDGAGGLWVREAASVRHLTWDGRTLARWSWNPGPDDWLLEAGRVDHELVPDGAGGFWTFASEPVVSRVPAAYGSVDTVEVTVDDNPVVHVGADGRTLARFPLLPLLDPHRSGWDALGLTPEGWVDFLHANAALPLDDGGVLVTIRNQDVAMRLHPDGRVRWMFGDPSGWSADWQPLLLTPVGPEPFSWPYHTHGVAWDEAEGLLHLFDNHTVDSTPYGPAAGTPHQSRGVVYRIDEAARTVELAWSFAQTTNGALYAPVLGETEPLPQTGNRLVVWGSTVDEGVGLGWGEHGARIVEVDPADEIVLDLSIHVDAARAPNGVWVYRAARVPPLADLVTTTASEPSPR
jgi:hypothetical protein